MATDDLHPIELAAHAILSGPLDTLHDNFELLNQSQYVLLTRLQLIETRLTEFKKAFVDDEEYVNDKEIQLTLAKVKELKKSLQLCCKTLEKVEHRTEKMKQKLA